MMTLQNIQNAEHAILLYFIVTVIVHTVENGKNAIVRLTQLPHDLFSNFSLRMMKNYF